MIRGLRFGLAQPALNTPLVSMLPEPASWPLLQSTFAGGASASEAARFRAELGLPAGQVVISGHQAAIWHAGIVAKVFALAALAKRGAATVWLTVDQDANDPFTLRLPVQSRGGELSGALGGALGEIPWPLHAPGAKADVPAALRPAFDPSPPPQAALDRPAFADEPAIARAIAAAITTHRNQPSAAAQLSRAALDLACARGAGDSGQRPQPALLMATAIARTALFAQIIERMARDPAPCVEAYNAAALRCRVPGIGPLAADRARGRYELPLWHIDRAEGARKRVFSHTLAGIPVTDLAPKALLMTGLLRAAACELFIHGTGGGATGQSGGYDKVTEQWMLAWLGWQLAPSVVVSATMRLPLGDTAPVTEEDLATAVVNAHRAMHTPAMLGDAAAGDEKQRLLEVLKDRHAPRTHRRVAFSQMHDMLAASRQGHAGTLATINASVADLRARQERDRLAADRTWPFPLHGAQRLANLASLIAARFP